MPMRKNAMSVILMAVMMLLVWGCVAQEFRFDMAFLFKTDE